jgi:transcriptional regulator with XRE-family HTH domain
MARYPISNFLIAHRKKWGLSQRELAALLGVSRQAISNYELEVRPIPAKIILAAELLFGEPFHEVFPKLYEDIEDEIGARAMALQKKYEGRTDASSRRKFRFFAAIPLRLRDKDES